LLGKLIPTQLPVSGGGQQASARWAAGVVYAAGAGGEAGLWPELPVRKAKGSWLPSSPRRTLGDSRCKVK